MSLAEVESVNVFGSVFNPSSDSGPFPTGTEIVLRLCKSGAKYRHVSILFRKSLSMVVSIALDESKIVNC